MTFFFVFYLCSLERSCTLLFQYLCLSCFTSLVSLVGFYTLLEPFGSFISLFGLSAILKICTGEHAHYLGLAAASAWGREKQMSVALGKEFDLRSNNEVEFGKKVCVLFTILLKLY